MPGLCLLSTRKSSFARGPVALVLASVALWALTPAASAEDLLSTTVSAGSSAQRECFDRPIPGAAGVVTRQVATPMSGIVAAKRSSSPWRTPLTRPSTR